MKFKKGVLYLRLMNGKPDDLFYTLENIPKGYTSFHSNSIAHVPDGEYSHPRFGGDVEFAQHVDKTRSGNLVEFKKADDDSIREILKIWDSSLSIPSWVAHVRKYTRGLPENEIERIAKIAKEFM
ncbi:MAG: hypothetical protein ABIA11_00585 [Patescibacteria group bacterium]